MLRSSLAAPAVLVLAVLAACLGTSPSAAGWGPDGITLEATADTIPQVAAVNDGAFGAIVAWQDGIVSGSRLLRAHHVLATGDLDPAWPTDGALLSDAVISRDAVGAVTDAAGGAYVWWKEDAHIYLTRVDASGAVASGWPARGRWIGKSWLAGALPSVIADGSGGVGIAWSGPAPGQTDSVAVYAMRLGPGNTGKGGWPNSARTIAGGDAAATFDYWPQLALAPGDGFYVAWGKRHFGGSASQSAYRIRRLTASGLNSPGWPVLGITLGPFRGDLLAADPVMSLVAISEDGRGGAFALIGLIQEYSGFSALLESTLFRIQSSGIPAADWPVAGALVDYLDWLYFDQGADASMRLMSDGMDGAHVGAPIYTIHGGFSRIQAIRADGTWEDGADVNAMVVHEMVSNRRGGAYVADVSRYFPSEFFADAVLALRQTRALPNWVPFFEPHWISPPERVRFFGDIGLAESGDGGVILFWSQVRERFGLFARRFNGVGQVTDVGPGPFEAAALSLARLRFVAGDGVRAATTVPPGEAAELELFDVAGRRLASLRLTGEPGAREALIPRTRDLSAGLYFVRLTMSRASAGGKVIVTR